MHTCLGCYIPSVSALNAVKKNSMRDELLGVNLKADTGLSDLLFVVLTYIRDSRLWKYYRDVLW